MSLFSYTPPVRALGLAFVLAAACLSCGCLVVTLQPVYTDSELQTDEGLAGTWESQELGATAVVERGEWKAYRIAYTSKSASLAFVGYLTKIGETRYLDLTPVRGLEAGPLMIPAHGVCRFERAGNHLTLAAFDYDWFVATQQARTLGKLEATFDGRQNLLLTSPTEAVRAWLLARPAAGDEFREHVTFVRKRP